MSESNVRGLIYFSSTMDGSVPSSVSCKPLGLPYIVHTNTHCYCLTVSAYTKSSERPPPQHVPHSIPPYIWVCVHDPQVKVMCCLREGSLVCQTKTKRWEVESPHRGWMLARACQTRVSCAVSVCSKCRLSQPQPGLHCVESGGLTILNL